MNKIIWLRQPLSVEGITGAASLFGDINAVHRSQEAALEFFGDEATGPVAPGAFVVGLIGGEIVRRFGTTTKTVVVTGVDRIRLTRCFCPGDTPGLDISIKSTKVRGAKSFQVLILKLWRLRPEPNSSLPASHPMHVEILSQERHPTSQEIVSSMTSCGRDNPDVTQHLTWCVPCQERRDALAK